MGPGLATPLVVSEGKATPKNFVQDLYDFVQDFKISLLISIT